MKTKQMLFGFGLLAGLVQLGAAAMVFQIDLQKSGDPTSQETQSGWTAWGVDKTENVNPKPASVGTAVAGVGITITANGGGYVTSRGGDTDKDNRGGEITGTSWNDVVEDLVAVRNGDGTATLSMTGLDPATIYKLTIWDNDSYTVNAGFASGNPSPIVAPSVSTGTLAGTADSGVITHNKKGAHTDADFDNIGISFTPDASGNADILLSSTSTYKFVAFNGLRLETLQDADADGLGDLWEDLHFGDGDGSATPEELARQSGADDGYPTPDGDGLDNLGEQAAQTDPNKADTDEDGINDGDELSGAQNPYRAGHVPGDPPEGAPGEPTNPLVADSDNDGILDGEEVAAGTDGFATNPNAADTDGDTMPDKWEADNGIDPTDDGSVNPDNGPDGDPDGDDLANAEELLVGTDPQNPDTDGDGYEDGVETGWTTWTDEFDTGTDPTNPDTDGDGLKDGMENPSLAAPNPPNQYTTDPNVWDSDGDFYGDGEEIAAGTDPLDKAAYPADGPAPVLGVDFHMEGPTDQQIQTGWEVWEVDRDAQTASIANTFGAIGITMTAGGGGAYVTARGGAAANRGGDITGTPWNDAVEDLAAASNGDGTLEIAFTGLSPALAYTLTVFHNDPYTMPGNPGFASGDGVVTPSVTTGAMVGSAVEGMMTNTRPGARTAEDFHNSVVAFVPDASGNAAVLLSSTTQFVAVGGLKLASQPKGAGSELRITDVGFAAGGALEVTVTGLDTAKSYVLKRSADLDDGFPETAFGPFTPTGGTRTVSDASPPAGKAFYRIEEAP